MMASGFKGDYERSIWQSNTAARVSIFILLAVLVSGVLNATGDLLRRGGRVEHDFHYHNAGDGDDASNPARRFLVRG
jgi:hypothetical protein